MFSGIITTGLAVLSFALNLWQAIVAARFPLHQRTAPCSNGRPVTLLKPLKGCDAHTADCLRSWLTQEYPARMQVLFGVASEDDPVCPLVRQLIAEFPKLDAQLVICGRQLGANPKVSTLVQLEFRARYEVVVVSDADVWAPPDLLSNLLAPLDNEQVGLVNCFYSLANPTTTAMRWEAIAINADFWPQVLQAQSLKPIDFALGAVMATTRKRLDGIGGFNALVDYLADDYQLGHKIVAGGAHVNLCQVVVQCRSGSMGWRQAWNHQLRWTRTIRACQPVPFFFSVLNNATLWPLLWLLVERSPIALGGTLVFVSSRILTATVAQHRLTREWPTWANPLLVLFKDLSAVVLWALAFAGNRVHWRGQVLRMERGGRLIPDQPSF